MHSIETPAALFADVMTTREVPAACAAVPPSRQEA